MILQLPYKPFKKLSFLTERPVNVILDIGVLEDVCNELGIEFWQIKDFMEKNDYDFSSLLLWHGYINACQQAYKKPKYKKSQALLWYEFMSRPEREKFVEMIRDLFGKIVKAYQPADKKKANPKQPSMTSATSH